METEIIVIEENPIDSHDKFKALVLYLQKMAERASTITEPDKEMQKELQSTRVKLEKIGLFLRSDFTKKGKEVIDDERKLVGIIKPEEDRLKKLADDAKEAQLKAERKASIPNRIARLSVIGITDIKEESLLDLTDDSFEVFYNKCVADKNEKDRKAIEDRERVLREQGEDLEREKANAINRQKEEIFKTREIQLEQLGFGRDTARAIYQCDGIVVSRVQLEGQGWDVFIEELIPRLKDAKIAADAKAKQDIKDREEKAARDAVEAERERVENATREETRIAKEKEEQEREAKEKREAEFAYQGFLAENGYDETTKDEFKLVELSEGMVVLYKRVAVYIPQ
jgi:hypothetical protein